jgi:hypothetical protein
MSVPYLREAVKDGDSEKLIRFVRLHLGDGNENVGRKEIDKSWTEALKILLHDQEPDCDFIEQTMQEDSSTLALLYFHLHFYFIRNDEKLGAVIRAVPDSFWIVGNPSLIDKVRVARDPGKITV